MGEHLATAVLVSFDERFKQYERYMHKVANTYCSSHPFHSEEDIFQELSIKLWECTEKDQKGEVEDFHKHFGTAVANRIADLYRLKLVDNDKSTVRIDAIKQRNGTKGGTVEKQRGPDLLAATRTDESEDFYRAGIFELIESVDPETAKVIMESLDPKNRGPKPGRARAFEKVRNKLNNV